jgi:hypothetical protein
MTDSVTEGGKSIKDRLIGAWKLVSVEARNKNGAKVPFLEGGDIQGFLMFDDKHFSIQTTSEFPKIASDNRLQTTPEENKAVAHGFFVISARIQSMRRRRRYTFTWCAVHFPIRMGRSGSEPSPTSRPMN